MLVFIMIRKLLATGHSSELLASRRPATPAPRTRAAGLEREVHGLSQRSQPQATKARTNGLTAPSVALAKATGSTRSLSKQAALTLHMQACTVGRNLPYSSRAKSCFRPHKAVRMHPLAPRDSEESSGAPRGHLHVHQLRAPPHEHPFPPIAAPALPAASVPPCLHLFHVHRQLPLRILDHHHHRNFYLYPRHRDMRRRQQPQQPHQEPFEQRAPRIALMSVSSSHRVPYAFLYARAENRTGDVSTTPPAHRPLPNHSH
jgi:hypothetical protein